MQSVAFLKNVTILVPRKHHFLLDKVKKTIVYVM